MNTDLEFSKKEPEGDDSEGTDEEEDSYAEAGDRFRCQVYRRGRQGW